MSPAHRLHALITSITISLMYGLITFANNKLKSNDYYPAVSATIGLFLSAGIYRSLKLAISWLMHRSVGYER